MLTGAFRSQGYGLTETNSIAVCVAADDYVARPASTSVTLISPLCDLS